MERLLIQSLQFLTVLLFGVHLYLKCEHFKKLSSFLDVVHTFLRLAGLVELFDDFGQTREVTLVKTQLAQLREDEEQRITGGDKKGGRGGWGKRRSRKKREDYRGDKKRGRGRMGKEKK